MEFPALLFSRDDLDSYEYGEKREREESCGGGVRHHELEWFFPDELPCAYFFVPLTKEDEETMKREGLDVSKMIKVQPPLARNSLAALGLVASSWFSRVDYLETKTAVDAVSRSEKVKSELAARLNQANFINVLDVGAGTVSMFPFIQSLGTNIEKYVAIDTDAEALAKAPISNIIECRVADVFTYQYLNNFDLVVANAFADLISPQQLATLLKRLVHLRGGLVYLPITFTGQTSLEPPICCSIHNELFLDDSAAFKLYHDHLRDVEGQFLDVQALKSTLVSYGFELVAEAPSDWILPLGSRFTSYIVDFISNALTPRFLKIRDSTLRHRSLRWIKKLRSEATVLTDDKESATTRTLRATNVDLLFIRR